MRRRWSLSGRSTLPTPFKRSTVSSGRSSTASTRCCRSCECTQQTRMRCYCSFSHTCFTSVALQPRNLAHKCLRVGWSITPQTRLQARASMPCPGRVRARAATWHRRTQALSPHCSVRRVCPHARGAADRVWSLPEYAAELAARARRQQRVRSPPRQARAASTARCCVEAQLLAVSSFCA